MDGRRETCGVEAGLGSLPCTGSGGASTSPDSVGEPALPFARPLAAAPVPAFKSLLVAKPPWPPMAPRGDAAGERVGDGNGDAEAEPRLALGEMSRLSTLAAAVVADDMAAAKAAADEVAGKDAVVFWEPGGGKFTAATIRGTDRWRLYKGALPDGDRGGRSAAPA